MTYLIEYFRPKVLSEIESWPVDIVADYVLITELLVVHGPNLRFIKLARKRMKELFHG